MNTENDKKDEFADLVEEVEGNLQEESSKETEMDPEELIMKQPLISIAQSLYDMERNMKGMLYIQNCNADDAIQYRRENFYAIFGGPDPELIEEKELERLQKLDKENGDG